jgi:hypothetical protein
MQIDSRVSRSNHRMIRAMPSRIERREARGNLAMKQRVGIFLWVLTLSACSQPSSNGQTGGNGADSNSASVAAAPVAPPVLQPQEQEALIARASAIVSNRTYCDSVCGRPCSAFWQVSNPRITDSRLSESDGRLEITFSVTAIDPSLGNHTGVGACFPPAPTTGWIIGEPVDRAFLFNLEKWQSGWRIAS